MQRDLRILLFIPLLSISQIINTETPGKSKRQQIHAIARKYQKKDRKIAEKYTVVQTAYNTKKYKNCAAAQCTKELLTLSQLSDLANVRPEKTTSFFPSMIHEDDVLYFLEEVVALARDELLDNSQWVGNKTPYNEYFFNTSHYTNFKPYMQKVIVPPGSTIFAWGDMHGCIHSLIRTLKELQNGGYIDDNFMIIKPNTYLIYLGDCVDRGCYGLEVLYTLMRLKAANPDNVMLIRGNHEDEFINRNTTTIRFNDELTEKQFRHKNRLYRLYDMWAPVIYLGSGTKESKSFIMCCHGGLEIGLTPAALVTAPDKVSYMAIKGLNRAEMIDQLPKEMKESVCYHVPAHARNNSLVKAPTTHHFGYMWSEFLIEDPKEMVRYTNRGWKYGKELTRHILDRDGGPEHCIKSILRAHQHHELMQQQLRAHKGFFSLWNGMVLTVLSAPAVQLIPSCPFDSIVKITTAERWEDWDFKHLSNPMP